MSTSSLSVERSDSGVSESHSRQSSEPFTGSSEEQDDHSKELEDVAQHREWNDDVRMQNIEEQIREQEVNIVEESHISICPRFSPIPLSSLYRRFFAWNESCSKLNRRN